MASSSRDARTKRVSQPFARVLQPFAHVGQVPLRVGTFNLGLERNLIESKKNEKETLQRIRQIVAKGFEEGELHQLILCEVGGHNQSLRAFRSVDPSVFTDGALFQGQYGKRAIQTYVFIRHQTGASQPGGVILEPVEESEVHALQGSGICDAQLVLTKLTVRLRSPFCVGMLFSDQLHIRTPHKKGPTMSTRQRLNKWHVCLGS